MPDEAAEADVGEAPALTAVRSSHAEEDRARARELFEREYLNAQILRFSGNISRTAAFIGMERSALHRKLKSLGFGAAKAGEP